MTSSFNINGINCSGNSITVRNGKVTVDGDLVGRYNSGEEVRIVVVSGSIGQLNSDGSVTCEDVENVNAAGSVNCGDVAGDVTAGGSVSCDNVYGGIYAKGSVSCG